MYTSRFKNSHKTKRKFNNQWQQINVFQWKASLACNLIKYWSRSKDAQRRFNSKEINNNTKHQWVSMKNMQLNLCAVLRCKWLQVYKFHSKHFTWFNIKSWRENKINNKMLVPTFIFNPYPILTLTTSLYNLWWWTYI